MHSSDSVVPVSNSRPASGWYRNRRLLLASLTGSERRGTSSTAPGLVPSPRRPGGCRLLLASLTGSERRGTSSTAPGPVPSPRHPGRCRLLLSSLTGSERRGTSSRAPGLVPSPRHPGRCHLLLASLTGSERRGTLSTAPVLEPSSRRTWPHATMTCSFHQRFFERSKCSWWRRQQAVTVRHLLQRPTP